MLLALSSFILCYLFAHSHIGTTQTEEGWGFVWDWLEISMTSADDWFFHCETYFIIHYLMESLSWLLGQNHNLVIREPVKPLTDQTTFQKNTGTEQLYLTECPTSNFYYSSTHFSLYSGSVLCLHIKHLLLHEVASIYKVFYCFLQGRKFAVHFRMILILLLKVRDFMEGKTIGKYVYLYDDALSSPDFHYYFTS